MPIAEFACNNAKNASTGHILFELIAAITSESLLKRILNFVQDLALLTS